MFQHGGKSDLPQMILQDVLSRIQRVGSVQAIILIAWSMTVLNCVSFSQYLLLVQRVKEIVDQRKREKQSSFRPDINFDGSIQREFDSQSSLKLTSVLNYQDICQLYQSYLVHTQNLPKEYLDEHLHGWIMSEVRSYSLQISRSYYDEKWNTTVYEQLKQCFSDFGIRLQTNILSAESGYVVDAVHVHGQKVVIDCLVSEYYTRGSEVEGIPYQLLGNEELKYRYLEGLGIKLVVIPQHEYGFGQGDNMQSLKRIMQQRFGEFGIRLR
eukprot:TRINITY_DN88532_c0_g1_i1.p1 TRINITY_DN88532_c0_g1~~TRINITY_DN88532_c0_g1_i1.p1  ORF type:complete len:268 (+),score=24.20 TRINITY_DN88532_c0_g1_i1:94-897(+)